MTLLDSALVCAAQKRCSKRCPLWKDACVNDEHMKPDMVDLIAAQHAELVLARKVIEAAQPFGRLMTLLLIKYDEAERLLREALDNYIAWKESHDTDARQGTTEVDS